jgi:hypothetical protein
MVPVSCREKSLYTGAGGRYHMAEHTNPSLSPFCKSIRKKNTERKIRVVNILCLLALMGPIGTILFPRAIDYSYETIWRTVSKLEMTTMSGRYKQHILAENLSDGNLSTLPRGDSYDRGQRIRAIDHTKLPGTGEALATRQEGL